MAPKLLFAVLGTIAAASPALANPEPVPPVAPAGTPETEYCMRIEITGNIIEPVRCWTRQKWADQGVDVDKEWAENGVAVRG